MAPDDCSRLAQLKPNLVRRAIIFQYIRIFFQEQGFLEVDTPIRVPAIAPELYIKPVLSEGWYLSTSPELYMKRLIAAGYERLYQFCHCFRSGERGRFHNPEFMMLEWYRTGCDYRQMITDTEQVFLTLMQHLAAGQGIKYQGQFVDLSLPWPRITVSEAFIKYAGWNPVTNPDPLRFDMDLCEKVVPKFVSHRPTVFIEYPAYMASLAKLKPDDPRVAERAEIFIGGLEIANAYSELVDQKEQEKRFQKEIELIEKGSGRKMELPRTFLDSMATLPECSGIALGLDRLAMLFCDAARIDDVVAFPADAV